MTDQKALKRRVRARMEKTGERYTAARRHVLVKTATPDSQVSDAPSPPEPVAEFRGKASSDEHLIARTGRPWPEWYAARLVERFGA